MDYVTSNTVRGSLDYDEIITVHDEPTMIRWQLPPLYKLDVRGQPRIWEIGFDGELLWVTHGMVEGNLLSEGTRIEVNTSGRTLVQQAFLQASRRFLDKQAEGYALGEHQQGISWVSPMLAYEYQSHHHKIKYPWYGSYKIDGLRMLVSRDHGEVVFYSRGKKRRDNLSHLRPPLTLLLDDLGVPVTLDGEIYVHGMPFPTIQSLAQTGRVATKHPVPEAVITAASQLQYWIFDILYHDEPKLSFYDRWSRFVTFVEGRAPIPSVQLVPVRPLDNEEMVTQFHYQMISDGFEGIMLRNPHASYVQGRTPHLLKLKDFFSDEGVITGVVEGSGTQEGVAYLVVRDRYGNTFNCNASTTLDIKRQWFLHPELVVGRVVTFKFQEYLKESRVPRFPVAISFRTE